MAEIGTDIARAKHFLSQSDLVAIPTETVYGLAGNAFNPEAVTKIFQVKNRPSFDPLIVHTDSIAKVTDFVTDIPDPATKLAKTFWPGPLTLLLPRSEKIPDIVSAGLPTVAVRVPNHPLTLQLLEQLAFPLAAPSANPFGYVSPTKAQHVEDQLGKSIPYILDGGPCEIGIESTIIGFVENKPIIYRLGGMSVEEIEKVAGKVVVIPHSTSNPQAPGMLINHYSPRKKVVLGNISELLEIFQKQNVAILAFKDYYPVVDLERQIILSSSGDLSEAAKNLFHALRELDKLEADVILAEYVPDNGLGRAINDRLRRASAT